MNVHNILADEQAHMLPFPGRPEILIHRGFLKTYMKVRYFVFQILSHHFEQGCNFICTGHSLGAAIAAICFWDIQQNLINGGLL